MNLGELRLKALQSLKRPYVSSPLPSPTEIKTTVNELTVSKDVLQTPVLATATLVDREEGEITDDSTEEEGQLSSESESYTDFEDESHLANHKSPFNNNRNYSRFNTPHVNKKPKYQSTTWRRNEVQSEDDFDLQTFNDLDSLTNLKSNTLKELDETQALLAASEDHEQDLHSQLRDCRALQRKCERDRHKMERKLEKINRLIKNTERIEDKVSCTNFKRLFVGKMYKETYLRSLRGFTDTSLYKLYSEILDLRTKVVDPRTKIDAELPCCLTELTEGKCPYKEESCTLQHLHM